MQVACQSQDWEVYRNPKIMFLEDRKRNCVDRNARLCCSSSKVGPGKLRRLKGLGARVSRRSRAMTLVEETGRGRRSLEEVHGSIPVAQRHPLRQLFAFLGPAYLVSVGYMDPGNWATDLEGGAKFGYALIWVLLMSNLMAVLLQTLAARLGVVTGHDLAQACRAEYSKPVNILLWLQAEVAIAACDLAEVVGTIIALKLLFGIPLLWGCLVTAFDTFLLLWLQKWGMRKIEAVILALVATIGACFLIQIVLARPEFGGMVAGL